MQFVRDTNLAVAAQLSARFGPGTGSIIRRLTNYHNIWFGCSIEPSTADANANGQWILWLNSNTNAPDTIWTIANLSNDLHNMQVIACGSWAASNQTPYMLMQQLKTSRNLVANQELVLTVHNNGLSGGMLAVTVSLCAGISVK